MSASNASVTGNVTATRSDKERNFGRRPTHHDPAPKVTATTSWQSAPLNTDNREKSKTCAESMRGGTCV
jgi:hypothetical protein